MCEIAVDIHVSLSQHSVLRKEISSLPGEEGAIGMRCANKGLIRVSRHEGSRGL